MGNNARILTVADLRRFVESIPADLDNGTVWFGHHDMHDKVLNVTWGYGTDEGVMLTLTDFTQWEEEPDYGEEEEEEEEESEEEARCRKLDEEDIYRNSYFYTGIRTDD